MPLSQLLYATLEVKFLFGLAKKITDEKNEKNSGQLLK